MKNYSLRLKKNILGLLHLRKWTLEKLAIEAECSKGYLSEILSGKHYPSLGLLEKLALALEVDVVDLLKKTEETE